MESCAFAVAAPDEVVLPVNPPVGDAGLRRRRVFACGVSFVISLEGEESEHKKHGLPLTPFSKGDAVAAV